MLIERMAENDKDDFLSLCKDFYDNHATLAPYSRGNSELTFRHIMENHENMWGYIFRDSASGESIGYSLVSSYWCNEEGGEILVLDELYISPKSRHNGYGTKFLEWLQEEFRGKAVELTLEVLKTNQNAKSLYKENGLLPDGFETLSKKL